jgi:hypothetical protein
MRGKYRRFQRRLPRAYSRFDDGHPGRRQIGSGGWADRVWHSNNGSTFGEAAPHAAEGPQRHSPSTTDAAPSACSSAGFLLGGPTLYLGTQPELYPPSSKVKYWLRHVRVSPLILGDGVAVGESKDFGNALCVEEILGVDLRGHVG